MSVLGLQPNLLSTSSSVYNNHLDIKDSLKKAEELFNTNADESLKFAFKALKLSTQESFDPGRVDADRVIGEIYISQANYPDGFSHLVQALNRANESNYDEGKARVLNSLGQFYLQFEQYPKSIGYFNQSIQLSKEKNFTILEAYVTSNLASAFQKSGDNNQAEKIIKESLMNIKKMNLPVIEATDYLTMGDIDKSRRQFNDALNQYNNAYTRYQVLNDNKGQLNTLFNIGKTYLDMENASNAEVCLKEVLEKSRKLKYSNLEISCYEQLGKVYKMSGNYLRSEEDNELFNKLRAKSESLDKLLAVTQINSNSQLEQEQKKNENLTQEKKASSSIIIILVIAFPIIIGISILLGLEVKKRKKVNIQLSKQKEELEDLNVVKDRLFSIIGHDLRSPLANLEAILKLMDSGDLGLDDVLNLTKRLTNDVQETSIMLENLLHWSNTQMKGIPPKYEDVELLRIAKDTITFLKPQSDKKSIALKISKLDDCVTFADKEMIRLILRNLVANAIKFTPHEGTITIEISKLENEAKVSVIDTGIGIKEENIKKIFSNQPITTRGTENEKGTGLGLMLCRDFVEKNKGRIWVTSELGKGSTFSFTIPLNV